MIKRPLPPKADELREVPSDPSSGSIREPNEEPVDSASLRGSRPPDSTASPNRQKSFEELFQTKAVRSTWKQLRRELAKLLIRDCIDFAEFDLPTTDWIEALCREVVQGSFQPLPPTRREVAKAGGAFRVITATNLRDSLVYRHICDHAYDLAKKDEWKGAYFSRRYRKESIGEKVDRIDDDDYLSFYDIWKRYAAYRTRVGLSGLYPVMVVTDLSNYFDSIQHELLFEHLGAFGIPRKALGVLGKLLDVLRPESGHSASPAVGLPTDELDCSRTLAHIFLFEHDLDIANFAGADAYVRWMDDQNVGVANERHARQVVRQIVQSLSRQRLTLNSGKTKFLNPTQVAEEYWLDANEEVDALDSYLKISAGTPSVHSRQAMRLTTAWSALLQGIPRGHWDKIAKRILLLAARSGVDVATTADCYDLLIRAPAIAPRIFEYLVARDRFDDLFAVFDRLLSEGESLYEDVEMRWFESLLIASPPCGVDRFISLAHRFVRGEDIGVRRAGARVPAALLLYWFGGDEIIDELAKTLASEATADGPTRRAVTAILCARKPDQIDLWLATAAALPQSTVSNLISWLLSIRGGAKLVLPNPVIFPKRLASINRDVYDARVWLRLELLLHSPRLEVLRSVKSSATRALKGDLGAMERRVAERVLALSAAKLAAVDPKLKMRSS